MGGFFMPRALECITCAALAAFPFAAAAQQSFQTRYYPFDNLHPAVQVDLNNDGIPDFIAENRNQQTEELLSSGGGNYTSKAFTIAGSGSYPIASADFDYDGLADVVFWNPYAVARGTGNGGFSSYQTIPWSGTSNYARAVVADFNHDGAPDVAVAYDNASQFQVVEFLNDGSGPITPKVIYTQPIPSGSTAGFAYTTDLDLVLGDFDADGNPDLVLRTTESDPSNPAQPIVTLTALYGNGGGIFAQKTIEVSHTAIYEIAAARLNADGTSDIVANNFSGGSAAPMRIYYGQTNRTFNAVNQAAANDRAINPMLADFNGDLRKDIIYPAQTSAAQDNIGISELLRTSSGTYTQQPFYPNDTYNAQAGVVPFSQTFVGDYNHDGRPDVAMISSANQVGHPNNLVIMLNQGVPPDGTCMTPSGVGIAICSPAPGATVSRPFNVTFSANYLYPLRDTQVWIDGVKKSEQFEAFDTQAFHSASFFPSTGKHTIGLFAVTYDGKMLLHRSYTITVK
jgi:hypothetical protein